MRNKIGLVLAIFMFLGMAIVFGATPTVRNTYDNAFSFMATIIDDYNTGDYAYVTGDSETPVALGRVSFSRNGYVYCVVEQNIGGRRPEVGDFIMHASGDIIKKYKKVQTDDKFLNDVNTQKIQDAVDSSKKDDTKNTAPVDKKQNTSSRSPNSPRSDKNDIPISRIGTSDSQGAIDIQVSNDNRGLISLKAENAPLSRVLQELADKTGSAVYVDTSVESGMRDIYVTYSFKQESMEAGLSDLLGAYGLTYFRNGGSFRVVSKDSEENAGGSGEIQIEKIHLSYVDADTMRDILLSMDLHPAPEVVKAYVGPMHPEAASSLAVGGDKNWTNRDMPNEQVVTARKDFLLVKADKEVITEIRKVVKLVDVAPKQMIIKTIVLEVDRNNIRDIGADNIRFPSLGKFGTAIFSGDMANGALKMSVASRKVLETSSSTLYADIHALILDQKAKIINNPTITTLDGQPAIIRVGKEIPIESTSVEVKDGINLTATQVDYRHIGMSMYVLPRIDPDTNQISLLLHPSLSEIESEFKMNYKDSATNGVFGMIDSLMGTNISGTVGDAGSGPPKEAFPNIIVRETNSIVRVENGEEVIIGGLIRRENKTRVKKVPFLSDFPIVGGMFRRQQDYMDEQELIIILVPYIVDSLNKDEKIQSPVYDLIYQDYGKINQKLKKDKNKDAEK
ncbi:MAG: hypothetical protein WCX65_10045 [bacterium]